MRKTLVKGTRGLGTQIFLTTCLVLFLGACSAKADTSPCLPGTIATVMAQGTCTIGNGTFDFTNYQPYSTGDLPSNPGDGNSPNSANDVTFTPLTANPLSPGFELSTATGFSSTVDFINQHPQEYGTLFYTISATNGNLVGISETVNTPFVSVTPGSACSDGYIEAYNELNDPVSALAEQYALLSTCPPTNTTYSSGPQTFAPMSSGSGSVFFETYTNYGCPIGVCAILPYATATMSSVDYTFFVQTPEPSSLLLLVTGLLGLMGMGLYKRRLA